MGGSCLGLEELRECVTEPQQEETTDGFVTERRETWTETEFNRVCDFVSSAISRPELNSSRSQRPFRSG